MFFPQTAYADVYTVTGAQDFFFEIPETQQFTARTYAWQYGIDSHLWLYNSEEMLVAANDDYFGLDSFIQMELPAGTYRMRAGVCCGDPTRWYGASYTLDMTSQAINAPTTTVEATTTTEAPTTTTEPPTTTTEESTTTTSTIPETTVPETTLPEPTTTLLLIPSTLPSVPLTTVATTTTVVDIPTSTVPETTLPEPTTTSSTTTFTTSTTTQPVVTRVPTTTTSTLLTTTTVVLETVPPTIPVPPTTAVPEVTPTTVPSSFAEVEPEKLEQFFETLNMSALTEEEQEKFIEEISNASDEVKSTFENSVNIYSGEFEEYVPTGSVVSVRQRKVIIAATGVLFVAPTISTSPPSAPPSGSPSGGSPSDSPSGSDTKSDSKSRRHRRGN